MSIRMAENIVIAPMAMVAPVEQAEVTEGVFDMDMDVEVDVEMPQEASALPAKSFLHISTFVRDLVPSTVKNPDVAPEAPVDEASPPADDASIPNLATPVSAVEMPADEDPVSTMETPNPIDMRETVSTTPHTVEPALRLVAHTTIDAPENSATPQKIDQTPRAEVQEITEKPAVPGRAPAQEPNENQSQRIEPKPEPTVASVPKSESSQLFTPAAVRTAEPVLATAKKGAEKTSTAEGIGRAEVGSTQSQRSPTAPLQSHAPLAKTPVHNISAQIAAAVSSGSGDTIELRLDPPELGRIHVSITHSDHGISAVITAEKVEIADLLRRNSEVLMREFSKSGFDGASLRFAHQEQSPRNSESKRENILGLAESTELGAVVSPDGRSVQTQLGGLDIRL